ncbi:MAG: hypothetical protein CMH52_09690 [Myxococcales bacterium]|nr:hypothetical protein [Myxococcales bacterium]
MKNTYLNKNNVLERSLSPRRWVNLLIFVMVACTDAGGDGSNAEADRGILIDAGRDAYIVSGDGSTGSMDVAFREPDAAPRRCLAQNVELQETFLSDPLADATDLYARYEHNGDQQTELIISSFTEDRTVLSVWSGNPPIEQGRFDVAGQAPALFMGGDPNRDLRTQPIRYNDRAVIFATQNNGETLTVSFFDASTYEQVQRFELLRAVDDVQIVPTTTVPTILANLQDGGCVIQKVDGSDAILDRGQCRVRIGQDANGDERPEAVQFGRAGLALIDINVGAVVATAAGHRASAVGYTDAHLISATLDGQTMRVNIHDKVELTVLAEEITNVINGGQFSSVVVIDQPQSPNIIAQYEKSGFQSLRVFELGDGDRLRRVGEFGPFRALAWRLDADLNSDGIRELVLLGGSRADGFNTDVEFRDIGTGAILLEIGALRNVRFTPIWNALSPPQPSNIDNCAGDDFVVLREGQVNASGERQTRITFRDEDNVEVTRTETYTGRVHQLVISDLDGLDPPELIELRSDEDTSARLRVFGPN